MQRKTYLSHYRVAVNESDLPVELRRFADAVVYKGEDRLSGQEVALQISSVAHLSQPLREQLEAEAKTAKRLDHINIPILYDFGFDGDEMVYVNECFDGTTAEDWVASHGPLPADTMLRMALQAVSALGAAAFHGIFHYAINPRNIMLVPGQTQQGDWPLIKVLHFVGLAPALASSSPAAADPAKFASPEQLRDGKVDFRSEMYSLGCVLWFLVSGEAPQAGATTVETASGVSGSVKRLLTRMLAADPNNRPLDPLALQREINDCISHLDRLQSAASKFGLATPSSTASMKASAPPPPRKRSSLKGLALAALLLGLGVVAALILPDRLRSRDDVAASDEEAIGIPIGISEGAGARRSASSAQAPATSQTDETPAPVAAASTLTHTGNIGAPAPTTSVAPLPAPESMRADDVESEVAAASPVAPTSDQVANAPEALAESEPEAPVVTSIVEPPPAEESEAAEIAAADATAQLLPPVDDPANEAQRDASSLPSPAPDGSRPAAPVAAENSGSSAEELEPPLEGPAEVAAAAPSEEPYSGGTTSDETAPGLDGTQAAGAVAQSDDFVDERGAIEATSSKAKTPKASTSKAGTKRVTASKVAAKKTRSAAKKIRVASEDRPALPRGAIRAEFLGTTAEGNLIFGLPSSKRGYVAAPSVNREGASRQRGRRNLAHPDQLPVLPALPPDG